MIAVSHSRAVKWGGNIKTRTAHLDARALDLLPLAQGLRNRAGLTIRREKTST
jgi:hypothetical protein